MKLTNSARAARVFDDWCDKNKAKNPLFDSGSPTPEQEAEYEAMMLKEFGSEEQLEKKYSNPKVYYKLPEDFNQLDSQQQEKIISSFYNDIVDRDKQNFTVRIFVASMIGQTSGSNSFNKVNDYFIELHNKRPLKCWKRFCTACARDEVSITNSIDHHLVNTTFSNVKKIIKFGDFKWKWNNPSSEWALNWGDPNKYLSHLISEKSNPVCRVMIESLDFAIKNLNRTQGQKTMKVYRAILRSESKEQSGLVLTESDSRLWDKIESEVKAEIASGSNATFEIPSDWADD